MAVRVTAVEKGNEELEHYLSTQVKVAEEDGGFRAGHNQNDEDEKEESKHVVQLVRPA